MVAKTETIESKEPEEPKAEDWFTPANIFGSKLDSGGDEAKKPVESNLFGATKVSSGGMFGEKKESVKNGGLFANQAVS